MPSESRPLDEVHSLLSIYFSSNLLESSCGLSRHHALIFGSFDKHEFLQKWSAVFSLRPHTVLVSFGTFTRAMHMPQPWKDSLLEVVRRHPNVTFVWKYEVKPSIESDLVRVGN